jgi:hypothetical protein
MDLNGYVGVIGFCLGCVVGANVGLFVFGLLSAASQSSREKHEEEVRDRWIRIHSV